MKIGIVTTWFERGGAYVSRQYRQQLQDRHDVFVYARGGESYAVGDQNWDDEQVTWGKRTLNALPTAIDLDDFKSWVTSRQLDVVFFNEQHWWTAVVACRQWGPVVGTYVDYYTEQTVPLFDCYDFLICNTRRHYSVFKWHPQCHLVPWGTEVDVFTMSQAEPVNPGAVTFFHSGGVSPYRKGCDLVLEAFARLPEPAKLVLHVQRPLKEALPEKSSLVEELRASGRLTVYEMSVPAPGLFHLGDVYVYPTRLEGIGLTIAEANACGLPVITTACEPMAEFIEHGVNGRHVKVDRLVARADGYYWPQALADVDDLYMQMASYLAPGVRLAEEKVRARARAVHCFDWKRNAAGLAELFAAIRRRDDTEVAKSVALAVAFEGRRDGYREISPYHRLKGTLEIEYPFLFLVASRVYSAVKAPFVERKVASK